MKDKILITSDQIQSRVAQLGTQIAKDFENQDITFVCVLNGAFMFASDLSKAVWKGGNTNFEIEFVRISSYGKGKTSSANPVMNKDIEGNLADKNIVIVEDIIETGHTLKFLVDHLQKQKVKSIKICALLSKALREVKIEPDYLGFEIKPEDWVEGYGLDTGSKGRGRQEIIVKIE